MQQTCPTCRKEVPVEPPPIPDAAPTPAAAAAAAAGPAAPAAQGSPARATSGAAASPPAAAAQPHVFSEGVAAALAAAQAQAGTQPGPKVVLGPFTSSTDAARAAQVQRSLLFGSFNNMAPPMPGGIFFFRFT